MNLTAPSTWGNPAPDLFPKIDVLRDSLRAYRSANRPSRELGYDARRDQRQRATAAGLVAVLRGTALAELIDARSDAATADAVGRWLRSADARRIEAAQQMVAA